MEKLNERAPLMPSCKIVFVSGTVQGVGFRFFTQRQAKKLGLVGTVRNLIDGRVEIIICGASAILSDFIDWLHLGGPPSATITHLSIDDYPVCHFDHFTVTY